jgi:hypothetical protein
VKARTMVVGGRAGNTRVDFFYFEPKREARPMPDGAKGKIL